MRALRANVKPAHCKFKGRTFSANFSNSANACFLSTTDHPCTWTVSMPAEPLSVWRSPHETTTTLCVFYGESYAIQRPCCPPVNSLLSAVFDLYTVIKHTAGHVAFWQQPVGSLPLAQNAWHCTSSVLILCTCTGYRV